MSLTLFSIVCFLLGKRISRIKTEIHFSNMDNAQTLSWLFTYELFKLASYFAKAWPMRKEALYQDQL